MSKKSNKIIAEKEVPPIALLPEPELGKPWLGKSLTSLNPDGTREDPKAEFVAIGYPFLARSEDGQHVYVPTLGGVEYEVAGFEEDLHCAICRPVEKVKNAGTIDKG